MSADTNPHDPTDQALLRQAAGGARDAFEAIYRRYQQVVYRFARAMTGSPEAAEDVTQEVFVALMHDLARYDPERAALSTYLYGIARNLSRHRLRRERRWLSLETIGINAWRHEAGAADPLGDVAHAQATAHLRRALGTLPPRYREVIVLCDLHELPYAETALVLRIRIGTVRSRLHRGRRLLKQRLRRLERPAKQAADAVRCSI